MPPFNRRHAVALLCAAAALTGWLVARSDTAAALDHFRAGRYRDAAASLAAPGAEGGPTAPLLQACLATNPATALEVLEEAAGSGGPTGRTARIEAAAIRFGQGRHRDVVQLLDPLLTGDAVLPGRAHLLAGLSLRALGDADRAEGMLATVKPGDPAFAAARTALGDLALAENDPVKALRYYDSAGEEGRAGAGRWQALRRTDRVEDAERLRRRLAETAGGSVALLEISRILRAEEDEVAARRAQTAAAPDTVDVTPDAPAVPAGRYTLQLGAYSDRGLALDLLRRFRDDITDVRIDTERDARGQLLYKVRTGAYVNPAAARAEAERLERRLGIDVFVAETGE